MWVEKRQCILACLSRYCKKNVVGHGKRSLSYSCFDKVIVVALFKVQFQFSSLFSDKFGL